MDMRKGRAGALRRGSSPAHRPSLQRACCLCPQGAGRAAAQLSQARRRNYNFEGSVPCFSGLLVTSRWSA
eukprot:6832204-Pyramimonas_sp.AAC.3